MFRASTSLILQLSNRPHRDLCAAEAQNLPAVGPADYAGCLDPPWSTLVPFCVSTFVVSMTTLPLSCVSPGRWEWLSDSPSLLPPCDGAVSYYSQFGRVLGFTSAAGRCFRSVLEQHLDLLLWPSGVKASLAWSWSWTESWPWCYVLVRWTAQLTASLPVSPAGGQRAGSKGRGWTPLPLDPALLLSAA